MIEEGRHDPHIFKAVFMVGTPGAGKSFVGKKLVGGTGLKIVNPDEIIEYRLNNGRDRDTHTAYQKMHQKKDMYLDGRLGILIDQTGNNVARITGYKNKLDALGYDCAMVFVYVDPKVAWERVKHREDTNKRVVDHEYFEQSVRNILENVKHYRGMFGSNFYSIDNTNPDQFPILEKKMNQFFRQPLSKIAQDWKNGGLNEDFTIGNQPQQFKIYVDLDGVLADFDGHFTNTNGSEGLKFSDHEQKYSTNDTWNIVDIHGPKWWEDMPVLDEGMHLWHYLKHLPNVTLEVLSKPSDREDSKTGKIAWVKKNLGADVKVNLSKDKWKFASSKNDILIDDLPENVNGFIQYGGSGIIYRNFEDTVRKLDLLMGVVV